MKRLLPILLLCVLTLPGLMLGGCKGPVPTAAWKVDFSADPVGKAPSGWDLKKKPGTPPAEFTVVKNPKGPKPYLHMTADKASASIVTKIATVDVTKTPVLRWRWRAETLPKGADGRKKTKDDQAIGIYVGTGSMLNKKTVSYRWDTDTPKGSEGECSYGKGTIKVKWYTLRNKEDLKGDTWYSEERNFAGDFNDAWGFYPEKIYVSVSCNSQYTKTEAAADLDWIEFTADPKAADKKTDQK
ncbi:MAG: DUF3047 domain-containing protein [Candidatus Omnitrophota bacterium]